MWADPSITGGVNCWKCWAEKPEHVLVFWSLAGEWSWLIVGVLNSPVALWLYSAISFGRAAGFLMWDYCSLAEMCCGSSELCSKIHRATCLAEGKLESKLWYSFTPHAEVQQLQETESLSVKWKMTKSCGVGEDPGASDWFWNSSDCVEWVSWLMVSSAVTSSYRKLDWTTELINIDIT